MPPLALGGDVLDEGKLIVQLPVDACRLRDSGRMLRPFRRRRPRLPAVPPSARRSTSPRATSPSSSGSRISSSATATRRPPGRRSRSTTSASPSRPGEEFDASWNRGTPFEFKLGKGQVIPGWDAGVQGMKVGGRRKLTIPSADGVRRARSRRRRDRAARAARLRGGSALRLGLTAGSRNTNRPPGDVVPSADSREFRVREGSAARRR